MSKSITENSVEQITVNPDQTIQLVQNENKFENTAQYNQAVFDPSVVTPKTNKTLDDLADWKEYLHDPWKATESGEFRFEKYKPIMDMARDPVWYSLAEKYGRDMVMKTDTILGYYKPAGNAFDRTIDAWNYTSDSLRLADARTRLSDARASGNYGAQAKIENEIADLKYKLANRDIPFESETWSSLMSVAVSGARNLPEIVLANLAGWAAAPYTGGASAWAARGVTASVIYNDTYNIEYGNILHDIMTRMPEMPEEQAREYAKVGATLNAAVEAVPSLIPGLDVAAGFGQRTAAAAIGKGAKRSLWDYMKAMSAKDPRVTKLFLKKLFNVLGEMGIETGSESIQETLQDIISGSAVEGAVTGGNVLDLSEQRLIDFVSNPLSPENQELWNTFGYTAAGTGLFEGATRLLTGVLAPAGRLARRSMANAMRRRQAPTIEQRGLGATMNVELADRLHQMRQEGKTPDEVQRELWDRTIARGIAPENVYLDKQMAETLMQDPAVATAMEQLGVQAALAESENNGGLVEIDFATYDEVVNKDDALFQKIRTAISFSPEALSLNQFQAYVDSLNARSRTELENARQLADSVYNRVLNTLLQQGVDRQLAEAQAITAQFMANRAGTLRLGQPRTGEQAAARLEIRMPGQPGSVQTTEQPTMTRGEQRLELENAVSGAKQQWGNATGGTKVKLELDNYKAEKKTDKIDLPDDPEGVGYDENDFFSAILDELYSTRTDIDQSKIQQFFDKDSPIRRFARKWLAETEQGKRLVADGKKYMRRIAEAQKILDAFDAETERLKKASKEKTLYQFLGGQAIEEQNLGAQRDEAQRRVEAGEDPEVVRQETGFYQEADGSWVFEISDSDMQSRKASKFVNSDGTLGATGVTTLGEILDAPTLYKFVPWIKDLEVEIKNSKGQTWGEANSSKIWLYAKNFTTEDLLLDTLAHKIQHVLQRHYEFMQSNGRSKPKSGKKTFVYQPGKIAETVLNDPNYKRMIQLAQTLSDKVANIAPTFKAVGTTRQYMDLYARRGQLQQWAKDGILDQAEVDEFVDLYQKYGETERGTNLKFGDYLASGWEYMARNTATRRTLTEEQRRTTSPAQTRDMEGNVWIINAGSGNTNYVPAALPGAPIKEGGPTQISTQEPGGEGGGVIAGMFFREGDKLVITLTPNANATTLTHELFHWFAYELQEAYNSGEMTDYWKKKMEALARMVDAKPQADPADPTVMRYFLTAAQEEKAADMFLNFIKDGKIKNQEVRPLFSYLQDEFRRIFKLAKIKRYPISNDAQEVFDSIFAAQDVIEDEQRLVGMYQIVKPENADQGLYDFYTGEMASSQVRGTQELHRKWAGIEKYRQEEKYRKVYNETRLQVANELNQDVRYIVVEEAGKHGNDPMATWSALQTNPETSDLELSVDQVAEIISTTPDKTSEIDRITNERMDEHIQQVFKITPEEMGLKASRNASKVKALLAEALMREGKTLDDFDAEYKSLLDKADDQVAKSKLTRLADKEYWDTLESNIVERYAYAVANNDQRAMAAARRDQAIVNAIRMRAESITNRARRFQETAADFRGAQKKTAKSNEYKYAARDYDLLQSILEKFGFPINYARRKPTPVAEKLDNWIDDQEVITMTRAGELRNFIPFIQEGFDGDFPAMTGAQFEKLEAVFNAVKSVAGAKYTILLANDKALLSDLVKATNDNMKALGLEPFQKKNNFWSKEFGTMGSWTNPEPVVRALFPTEVLDKVWLPFIDAAVKAERFGGQWVQRYRAAKAKVDLSNKAKTYSIGKAFTNQQVADLFLAMGNQHAMENFLKAYEITQEQAEAVVSEALTDHPELADFVNEVWAIYGEATEVLDREFEERTNTLFVEKDHRSFEVNGIKFGGGYVPARKAMDYVPTDPRAGNQGGMVHDKKFEKLVTKAADGNVRSIVDITENELFQSAKQGFTAVEYNNARKYLLADGTKAAIGDRAFSFLEQWLTAYMAPVYDTSGWVRPLASLTTTAALGFRLSTALLQLSGLGPAMTAVGPRYFARGLTMAMKNGEWAPYFATKKGAKKSDYMNVRIADPRSSLLGMSITDAVRAQDANTKLGKVSKFLMGKAGNLAMMGIQYVDTFVANVTWNGAYLKALDSGKSEIEARREADSIVRTVQSDSLQVSRATAMQSSLARVFTAFATWIMAMQSGLRARLATKRYADAVVWTSMYMVLSPIFESFLKEATKIGGSDDDEEYLDRVLKACYNEIASTLGTTILPVAGIGGAFTTGLFSGIEEGITGEKEIFEVRQSNTPALQTAYRAINTLRYTAAGNLEKAAIYGASTVSSEAGKIVKYLLAE